MNNNPLIFHGEWWVPAKADPDNRGLFPLVQEGLEKHYIGTLTYYEDGDSTLELYLVPSNFHAKHYCHNDVIWGKDANGHIFTLFDVNMEKQQGVDFTNTKFVVDYILIGEHVLSADDTRFKSCEINFQYLRNWAFHDNIIRSNAGKFTFFKVPIYSEKLLETMNDEGVYWRLWQGQPTHRTIHDLTITQTTTLEIDAIEEVSIRTYMKHIWEFAQFLSIALYSDQNPTEIKFTNRKTKRESILLFKKETSVNPGVVSLIKFDILKEKLPILLNTWHENFEKIAPISSYLIDSLQKKSMFDVPDFLIIAQALDGYHKRFVNKKNGTDNKKYEDQIKILLKQFNDVEVIQKIKLKPQVLTASRHKYSHLLPDGEQPLAVEGDDLYWLTEKCKILLTCCILNMLGLTNKEINICCGQSPISQIIDSLPLELD